MANWKNLKRILLNKVDSTNLEAKRFLQSRPKEELVIVANEQSSGYGRSGKDWVSPKGNLYFSIILFPECSLEKSAQLSFVAALALYEVLERVLVSNRNEIKLKWPNDVLINGKKVAGIILESVSSGQSKKTNSLIIGVGLNVNSKIVSDEFEATTLLESHAKELRIDYYLNQFISNLESLYKSWKDKGFEPIRKSWLDKAYNINKKVSILGQKKKISGIFTDLDNNGNLLLKMSNGEIKEISGGSIYFKKG
ncbi:MAG: biotin--[acetyl-CoA-carboxylase] ligase [Rickettsiales bacterium]